jgi:hypothetical protein
VYANDVDNFWSYTPIFHQGQYAPQNRNCTVFSQGEFTLHGPIVGDVAVDLPTINFVAGDNGSYIFHGHKNGDF